MVNNGQARSKDWCFTINNPTEEEETHVRNLVENGIASYVVYGREVGDAGTPHLQGFVQLLARVRLNSVKGIPGLGRAHLETRRGTPAQASDYCKKDGDFEEYGSIGGQGQRRDIDRIQDDIKQGMPEEDLWDNHFGFMARYGGAVRGYRNVRARRDVDRGVEVLVLWGPTETGKSRFARNIDPGLFNMPDVTMKWFDGYVDQQVVLFDDFDGIDCRVADFLRYTDRYAVKAPVKGGFVNFVPHRIWITANSDPESWFPNIPADKMAAVRRRLTRVVRLHAPIDFTSEAAVTSVKTLLNIQ